MRRVAVTGLGIICPIGNSTQEVLASLREARSGLTHSDTYERMGFRSQVEGSLKIDLEGLIDRRAVSETPPWVEYSLTDKGADLRRAIAGIDRWADRWAAPTQ